MASETLKMSAEHKDPKAYSKPQLIEYGRVEEITKGTTGSASDYGNYQPK
jgi:hypothetical protein